MKFVQYIQPRSSSIFISDIGGGDLPKPVRGAQILSTPTCVRIAIRPRAEGKTRLIFGRADEVGLKRQADFDDWLICPSRKIAIEDGVGNGFLTAHLETEMFRIRIWRSAPISPGQVVIGFDSVNYVQDADTLWDFPRELFVLRSDPPRRGRR